MKRRIISIFLCLVIIFTMTACAETEIPEQNTEVQETQPQETEVLNPWKIEDCFEYYPLEKIKTMEIEEVKVLVKDMVYMSKTANLSPEDMDDMGWMFHHVWYQCPEYDKATLKAEFCEVFENTYNRSLEIGLALDFINSWLDTPVSEVAIKYISSDNFKEPFHIWGRAIINFSEEDLLEFTKAFVNNPLMETNATIARTIICVTENEEISQIAWEHLVRLSNSDAFTELTPLDSSYICRDIFDDYDLNYQSDIILKKVYSSEYILQIAENILDNPSFDFVEKYEFFCHDFLANSDLDIEISQMAMNKLQALLSDATYDDCVLIAKALSNIYHDESGLEVENISPPLREKYIYLLTDCLAKVSN